MKRIVTVDELNADMVEHVLCSEAYADKDKTSKRLTMFVGVKDKMVGFEILVNGKHYDSYTSIESAVEAYNEID